MEKLTENAVESHIAVVENTKNNAEWEFSQFPTLEAMLTTVGGKCPLQITPLQYINVCVCVCE